MKCNRKGQSVVEYSLVIGIVIAILLAMSPMVKRGTQAMVKVVADEVGYQQNSEQQVSDEGGLINTEISTSLSRQQTKQERQFGLMHSVQTGYNESTGTTATSKTSLGVAPD